MSSVYNVPIEISDKFAEIELSINSNFNALIDKLTERREQLLLELRNMKLDYINKEENRQIHIHELDNLISQLEETGVQQNERSKFKIKKDSYLLPNSTPLPHFDTDRLQQLMEQIGMLGNLKYVDTPYNDKTHPIREIGNSGESMYPYGVDTDAANNVYAAYSYTNAVHVYTLGGTFITEFGRREVTPYGVAVFEDWVFITDCSANQVVKYSVLKYKLFCRSDEKLNSPKGLTAGDKIVLVADSKNHRIVVLDFDLKLISKFGKGKLNYPQDVKMNLCRIFVADENKVFNVHVFSKSGDLLNSIINLKNGTGSIFLCLDRFKNILVSDSRGKAIQIYGLDGSFVHSIECQYEPKGIAVNTNNSIICADYTNMKINVY